MLENSQVALAPLPLKKFEMGSLVIGGALPPGWAFEGFDDVQKNGSTIIRKNMLIKIWTQRQDTKTHFNAVELNS